MSLNESQKKVILCPCHCTVVASPGSGKTRVLVCKAEYTLELAPKSKIVVTTFTKASASEIKGKISLAVGKELKNNVACGTFHSLAFDQLKRAGVAKKIVQGSEVRQLVERAMEESNIENLNVDAAISYINNYRTQMLSEHSSSNHEKLFASYTKLLGKIDAIDFTAMLSEAVSKMRSGEIPPKDCQYIFCDESQDMDPLQYAWVMEHIKSGAVLTMVGDDDQSIYRFRGCLGLDGMLDFKKKLGAETIVLDVNYRSHSEILEAAGNVIKNNTNRIRKNLTSHLGVGGRVEAWHCHSALKEANLVVKKIKAAIDDNIKKNVAIGLRKDEWAVLGRNHHNLNVLAMALKIEGIPHTTPEWDIWEEEPVCFAISLLKSIVDESRSGFESALYYAGFSQKILARCFEIYKEDVVEFIFCSCEQDLMELGEENSKIINEFTRGIQKLMREYAKGNVNFVIRNVFDWFKRQMNLMVEKNESESNKKKIKNEMKLMDIACKLLIKAEGTLQKRLQKVTNRFDGSESGQKISHEVYLGTLHSSKGLEFESVWLLQMDEHVIPDVKQFTQQAIEEERRLFYVGMTRAKKFLYISCTKYPSDFIFETVVKLNCS